MRRRAQWRDHRSGSFSGPDGGHKGSFVQGYNAQIAVDGAAQVIVAAEVTQQSNDKQQLVPMVEQVKQNVGAHPQAVSADNGYWNGKQVGDARVQGIDLHVATGKQKHGEPSKAGDEDAAESSAEAGLLAQMKQKLKTEAGRDLYRMRKAIVEPVFGQIKEWRGFRRFLTARIAEGASRMETDLPHPQFAQAVPLRQSLADVLRKQEEEPCIGCEKGSCGLPKATNEVTRFPTSDFGTAQCTSNGKVKIVISYSRQIPRRLRQDCGNQ